MPRALIAYSTVDGHTLKICRRVQQVLQGLDCSVMLFDIGSDQVPAAVADAEPNERAPSKTSTVAPACAVPESVSVALRLQL